ncbi:MAG TPA: glutamate ABC transporter substrate-binding protein [Actinomycetes bacterium]|nr:glutamate ABC transporter substrate-binding protein [Actinomycetes bacterium]
MQLRRTLALAAAAILTASLAACGGDDDDSPPVASGTQFPAGTTMAQLNQAQKVIIGVKYDQPGVGFLNPATNEPEGMDIEIAKIVAGALGIAADDIEFKETVSANREPFLQAGTVDIVLASYSITDERRQVVGQAGPYYLTGQQLLVREADKDRITGPDDLSGIKVCSVTGSTSIERVETEFGAQPVPFATYSECVQQLLNNSVDAVTTDGSILLGYAAQQPDDLEVVGEAFSEERYGIGYKLGDTAMCQFLNDTLTKSFQDGTWKAAFDNTLGKSGAEAPSPPTLDPC